MEGKWTTSEVKEEKGATVESISLKNFACLKQSKCATIKLLDE